MLYYLLFELRNSFSALNVFRYITFRTAIAALTALIISFALGPWLIDKMRAIKLGQFIREEGPKSHQQKAGTPTMGGILINVAILVPTVLWADLPNGAPPSAAVTYTVLTYAAGNFRIAESLRIPWVPQTGGLAVFCGASVGASLGSLWFNPHPAEIFMGDVGSLALGGAIGCIAVIVKQEILLGMVGGLFVLEGMSVVLQVASFKLTGRRIFKMSPLHHHFELSGWKETKVVVRFWIIAIIFALLSLSTLKLR